MPTITYIHPADQPSGSKRLLAELKDGLTNDQFSTFICCVAFAKVNPMHKLHHEIAQWRSSKKRILGIFGIDQFGTSREAVRYGLDNFNRLYITHFPVSSYHPKIYMFIGPFAARLYIGSNNLTVGGTETNFEAAACVDFSLPDEKSELIDAAQSWLGLLPPKCPATYRVTTEIYQAHSDDGLIPAESTMKGRSRSGGKPSGKAGDIRHFYNEGFQFRPPEPLPKPPKGKLKGDGAARPGKEAGKVPVAAPEGLAMQIKPHHNGEIFLSKIAVDQNPAFFGWPFTGETVPKKTSNKAYPQRVPDPKVSISVYGSGGKLLLYLPEYDLNTVYYEPKSEIRITASPLVELVPEYSIMIIQQSHNPDSDYEILVHTPDSPAYGTWLSTCNQQMPSGGKEPRHFGWF